MENRRTETQNKEAVTTAVLKGGHLNCEKCCKKVEKVLTKYKGVHEVVFDLKKEIVIVKGTMDGKALARKLTEKLFRPFRLLRSKAFEVFLSFRGEDTRASFTSDLHASLTNAGLTVFKDDDSLRKGDHISTSLLQAIEDSQISVVVFSRKYADSRWCLQELEKIMHCRKTMGQVVLPVFYGVDPSDVRNQTGEFKNAFQNVLNKISKEKYVDSLAKEEDESLKLELSWRKALREAADLAGFLVLISRNESEVIKDIVENITRLLDM